ncbi:hypothetical protein [Lutibacter sp.]|uniref:hypothetical protein n=1 Tax=Lutibacter sp. TaxID=1925666 RepID=UPI0035694098
MKKPAVSWSKRIDSMNQPYPNCFVITTSAEQKHNKQMANYADALLAFWNGKNKGTKNMIKVATKENLTVKIINFETSS